MSEIKDLHFKHTLSSGKILRLSVLRKADTKPRLTADSVAGLNKSDLAEYMLWRGEIVAAMMACLTPGEIEQCAVHGASKSEKGTGGPSMNLIPQGQRIAATKES